MKRNELIKLRKLVNQEIERRKRIEELLKENLVQEYLELTKINSVSIDHNNIEEILNQIIDTLTITETNGIYVCTRAWRTEEYTTYEDTSRYSEYVDVDSKRAEYKTYGDIESDKVIMAVKKDTRGNVWPLISDFERDNIVLNPYNTSENENGYDEVKIDFFKMVLDYGQAKGKKLILEKYPRI